MNDIAPFFSVVIPTYNSLAFLKLALQSVLVQTDKDFEVLVIDNQSQDGTREFIGNIADERVHYFDVVNEGIIGLSRNVGIVNATGEWICFLDADDLWYPEKLARVRDVTKKKRNAILVGHDEYFVYENGIKKLRKSRPACSNVEESLLRYGSCLMTSAVSVRRDVALRIGGFSEKREFATSEDYEFWIRLSREGLFYFLEEVLGEWRLHGRNTSSQNISMHAEASIAVGMYHLDIWKKSNKSRKWVSREIESRIYSTGSHAYITDALFLPARKLAIKSVLLAPFRWKAWAVFLLSLIRIRVK